MKLKGVWRLNRAVNKLTSKFNLKAKLDTEYIAYLKSRRIGYTLFATEDADTYFREYINELFPNAPRLSIFTWSVLHEIGHFQTEDDVTDWKYETDMKKFLAVADDDAPVWRVQKMKAYFRLESESLATQWACEYVKNNQEEVKKWNYKMCQKIIWFYHKNNVEMD